MTPREWDAVPTVLHVSQPTTSGVGAYVSQVCLDQAMRGWDVTVACPDHGDLAGELARCGIPCLDWPATRSPGPQVVTEALSLRRVLNHVRPDVVHLHSSKAGLAGRLAVRGRLPTLFQPHGWSWFAAPPGMSRAAVQWERRAARWTTSFVCVGDGEVRQGRAQSVPGRYTVVHNGVDLETFQPAGSRDRIVARAHLGVGRDVPLALCVGRVTRQKGQDVLLAAWPAVTRRQPDAQLAILGHGELSRSLRRRSISNVIWPGDVRDVRPWYAAADVVVLPSRWEGLPLTLLEALAVGRAVVGSDIPGIADELPPGAGALVPSEDTTSLAAAVAHRLQRRDLAQAEGVVGARHAAAAADVHRTHDALAEVTARVARSPA